MTTVTIVDLNTDKTSVGNVDPHQDLTEMLRAKAGVNGDFACIVAKRAPTPENPDNCEFTMMTNLNTLNLGAFLLQGIEMAKQQWVREIEEAKKRAANAENN